MKKLFKYNKTNVIEVVYCIKKQFKEKMNNNALMFENYENKLKKKRIFEKRFRDEIVKLKKQILEIQNFIVENSFLDIKLIFENVTKRIMKISNLFIFSDKKTMLII